MMNSKLIRSNKRKRTKRDWLKLIDLWMSKNSYATLDWNTIMGLEGGYGSQKIKTIEDAVDPKNEGTWPYIWFNSDQKDYGPYAKHSYVYSLLFGRQISAGTINMVTQHLETRAQTERWEDPCMVVDWGGSIFTATDLYEMSKAIEAVAMVNLWDTAQMEFALWFLDNHAYPIDILPEDALNVVLTRIESFGGPIVFLFSEVLEHEKEPMKYFDDLSEALPLDDVYVASSFCTPAYGHHIPVIIDDEECHTVRIANARWRTAMEKRGFNLIKIEGWNSRLWWCKR
jgi:hypothetical protein